MFRFLAFLIICVFVFNMSVLSIAQEQPTPPEVKVPSKSNTGAVSVLTSGAACLGGAVAGGFLGFLIGSSMSEPNTGSGLLYASPSDAAVSGCIIGATVGGILMLVASMPKPSTTVSPNVFLGKSPAYIQAYIQAHQSKTATLKGLP